MRMLCVQNRSMYFYGGIVSIPHVIDCIDVISKSIIDVKAAKQYDMALPSLVSNIITQLNTNLCVQ